MIGSANTLWPGSSALGPHPARGVAQIQVGRRSGIEISDGPLCEPPLRPLSSPALAVQHVARQQVYAALLAERGRDWTPRGMANRLPDVPVNGLRATLNLLLGDRLLDIEPFARQRSLTLRLTGDGEQILTEILSEWESADAGEASSAAQGGQDAS